MGSSVTTITLSSVTTVWLCALICAVTAVPDITTLPHPVMVVEGSTAVLSCRIQDLGSSKVTWTSVTHDFVIYDGSTLKTNDAAKYSLINAQHGSIHDLQILELDLTDQGHYRCSVGEADSIVWYLDVVEMDEMPQTDNMDINVTDCCIARNVAASCLPACYPPDIDLDVFKPTEECSSPEDVISLTHCLTGGSNHDSCCLHRDVHLTCLSLCHNVIPLTADIDTCLQDDQINAMISCAAQGAELLPSEPTDVTALAVNDGSPSILVTWDPPLKNAETVIGYMVAFQASDETTPHSVVQHDRGLLTYRLTDKIKANMGYKIHVVALAEHGSSQRSVEIDIYVDDADLHNDLSDSIDDCCQRRGVNDTCRPMLCRAKTWSEFNSLHALDCYPYLDDVFSCLVGERNHTMCCVAYDVTSECTPLCSGEPPNFDSSLVGCVAQMDVIEACVQQGYVSQPPPPTQLMVDLVTNEMANIVFTASTSESVLHYVVQMRSYSKSEPFMDKMTLTPNTTSFDLNDLNEDTHYWVRVVAETDVAGSLPSETVAFMTYSASWVEPVEVPVERDPYNITECCINLGMPEVCWKGCIYRPNMTDYYSLHLQDCYSEIGSVLKCASDGRDHRECCKQRNIISPCEELCVHTTPGPLDTKFVPTCVAETSKAVLCYSEGLLDLPRHPDVEITRVTSTTITLNWDHPPSGSIIDYYIVTYKVASALASTNSTKVTNKTNYIIQDLQPATEYSINVFSVNENGTSAPSPTISEYTLQDYPDAPPYNVTDTETGRAYWQNISDCCQNTVSADCQPFCLNQESTMEISHQCFQEATAMLACYPDGQDHSLCCTQRDLPDVCIPICGGNSDIDSVVQATCMSYAHRDIILSCFLERQGLVPEAPLSFSAVQGGQGDLSVNLTWDAPAFCASDCRYTVSYWDEANPNNKWHADTTSTSLVVYLDTADNYYTFLVVAHNSYGSGPPSPKITMFITYFMRDIQISLFEIDPPVMLGQDVILACNAFDFSVGDSDLNIKWIYNNVKTISSNKYLHITEVNPDSDEGTYTCEVTDSVMTSSSSLFLPVKAVPRFDQFKIDYAPPGTGAEGKVACWFRGYPDTESDKWSKDGAPLEINSRMNLVVDRRLDTGITSYKIKFDGVEESDFGDYSIIVSNQFGSASCHVKYQEEGDTIIPAPAEPNPQECCAREGVSEFCQGICGYHINVTEALNNVSYLSCLEYFDTYIACGADGRDHSKCCQDSAVIYYCQPLCKSVVPGSVLADQDQLLNCLADWQSILSCMEHGSSRIPFSPTDITLSVRDEGTVLFVLWTQPLVLIDKVDHFTIYYKQIQSNITRHVAVNEQVSQYEITNLQPMKEYQVWMTAGNKYGNSLASDTVKIQTFAFESNQPQNLKATAVSSEGEVRLSWSMTRGEYYNSFVVHYREIGTQTYKQIHGITGLYYILSNLEVGKTYQAFVVGEGPVQSLPSTVVEFTAPGDLDEEPKGSKASTDPDKIAIGVGVTVAVIALIAIVLLVLFFVFKYRVSSRPVNETVTFENPGFGSAAQVKVHGLQPDGFNYGQLEEEGGANFSEISQPQQVYDNQGFKNDNNFSVLDGESNTDGFSNPTYETASAGGGPPTYDTVASGGDPPAAGYVGQESVATLQVDNSGS